MSLPDQVQAQLPGVLADLKELVAIESVSADSARAAEVERSAERIVDLLMDLRCPDVRVIRVKDEAPAVIGRFPAPEGKPTVCLYGHHDVQPEGDRPSVVDFTGPYAEAAHAAFSQAWGVAPVFIGRGGTIPMVGDFGKVFPDATPRWRRLCPLGKWSQPTTDRR